MEHSVPPVTSKSEVVSKRSKSITSYYTHEKELEREVSWVLRKERTKGEHTRELTPSKMSKAN